MTDAEKLEAKPTGYPSVDEQPGPVPSTSSTNTSEKKEKNAKKQGKSESKPMDVPTGPFVEKTKEELDKMSKDDRTKYYQHKMAHEKASGATKQKMTKEEMRKLQEAQRKAKEDKANEAKDGDQFLEELKLQGLTEEQARQVLKEMEGGEIEDDEEEDDDGADDLLGSVRKWMLDQADGDVRDDAIRDFNMKVRFQGHVDSTPPDHLGAILKILVEQMCSACDLSAPKVAPQKICQVLQPALEKWAVLFRALYGKIDVLDAVNVIIGSISEALAGTEAPAASKDSALVGCLMAVREIDDLVEDEDLLIGCKNVEPRSVVLDKFIEFLEDDDEEDEDD